MQNSLCIGCVWAWSWARRAICCIIYKIHINTLQVKWYFIVWKSEFKLQKKEQKRLKEINMVKRSTCITIHYCALTSGYFTFKISIQNKKWGEWEMKKINSKINKIQSGIILTMMRMMLLKQTHTWLVVCAHPWSHFRFSKAWQHSFNWSERHFPPLILRRHPQSCTQSLNTYTTGWLLRAG